MEDFIGVRDYRPGDNPRNIHLALSLRMADFPYQLAVREFEDPTMDDVCVVLDTVIPVTESKDNEILYQHEKSLSFAIALCRLLSERQYFVRFRAVDAAGWIDITITRPTRDIPILEARLARLRPISNAEPVQKLLDQVSTRGNDAILFISLGETSSFSARSRRSVYTVSPGVQTRLVREVVGA